MAELTITSDYIERLAAKLQAIMAREATDVSNPGDNATDDQVIANLQDNPDDLTIEEFKEEIQGLSDAQQFELVALMWLGRDDAELEDWPSLLAQAASSRVKTTEDYLLEHPHVAEYWMEGLEIFRQEA